MRSAYLPRSTLPPSVAPNPSLNPIELAMPALLEARVQRISKPPPKMGRVARSSIAFRLSSALMRSLFLGGGYLGALPILFTAGLCEASALRRQKDHLRAAPPPHWLVARDRQ